MALETETLDGIAILRESPDDLGVLLWQTIRSVELWAALSEAERPEAFAPSAYAERVTSIRTWPVPFELVEPLAVAAGVLRGTEGGRVVAAMREIAAWAEGLERTGTAYAAAQAAARCAPEEAEIAHETGRFAWANGDRAMAEGWFRQALTRARRSGDRTTFARSYLSLCDVFFDRGNLPLSRRAALRGLRFARRHSLGEQSGRAHHALMEISIAEADDRGSLQHAAAALQHYGAGHHRLTSLANDLAYGWLLRGYFGPAADVFHTLTKLVSGSRERLFVFANLARAAAGSGDEAAFREAARSVEELAALPRNLPWAADALLELGHGALLLGWYEVAGEILRRAIDGADLGAKHRLRHQAQAVFEALESEKSAAEFRSSHPSRTPPRQITAFASTLMESLPLATVPEPR